MIIRAAKLSLCSMALAFKSLISILPSSDALVTITFIPAITALAGLVPCAEEGIRHIFLF